MCTARGVTISTPVAALIDPHCAPAAPCCPVVLASTEIPESSQEVEPRPQERSAMRPWTPDGTRRAVSSCRAPGPARPPCPSAPSAHAWPSREVVPYPHSGTVRSPGVPARLTGASARHLGLQGWRGDWHSEEQWPCPCVFSVWLKQFSSWSSVSPGSEQPLLKAGRVCWCPRPPSVDVPAGKCHRPTCRPGPQTAAACALTVARSASSNHRWAPDQGEIQLPVVSVCSARGQGRLRTLERGPLGGHFVPSLPSGLASLGGVKKRIGR